MLHTDHDNIVRDAHAGLFLEQHTQVLGIQMYIVCKIVQIDFFPVMGVDVGLGLQYSGRMAAGQVALLGVAQRSYAAEGELMQHLQIQTVVNLLLPECAERRCQLILSGVFRNGT